MNNNKNRRPQTSKPRTFSDKYREPVDFSTPTARYDRSSDRRARQNGYK